MIFFFFFFLAAVDRGTLNVLASTVAKRVTGLATQYEYHAVMPALAKTVALGAMYGGLLTPTSGDKDHFWQERGQ